MLNDTNNAYCTNVCVVVVYLSWCTQQWCELIQHSRLGMLIPGKLHSRVKRWNSWVSIKTVDFARVCTFWVSLKDDGPTGKTTGQRGSDPSAYRLSKRWRADGSDDGPERKWPIGVAAGQLELTGWWQIGRFSAVNCTFYAVFRNGFFFSNYCGSK